MYGDIYCTVDIVSTSLVGLLDVHGVVESLESLEVLGSGLLDLLELLEALGLLAWCCAIKCCLNCTMECHWS